MCMFILRDPIGSFSDCGSAIGPASGPQRSAFVINAKYVSFRLTPRCPATVIQLQFKVRQSIIEKTPFLFSRKGPEGEGGGGGISHKGVENYRHGTKHRCINGD